MKKTGIIVLAVAAVALIVILANSGTRTSETTPPASTEMTNETGNGQSENASDESGSSMAPVTTGTPSVAASATSSTTTVTAKAAKTAASVAPVPSTPAAGVVKSSETKTGSAKAGDIEVSHATAAIAGSTVDISLSVENGGKAPDALVDMETALGGTASLVTKTGGKETEGRVMVDLPSGKSVSLEKGETWLRFTSADKTAKEGEAFPLVLHFRHAPNLTVMVPVGSKSMFGGMFGGN